METRASYVIVGVFTLSVIVGALLFVLWTAKNHQGETRTYEIVFEQSVSGLSTGSSVLLEGVKIGQVTSIKVSPNTPGQVLVRVSVQADAPVRGDSVATLEPQGVTGTSAVAVTSGSASSPLLKPEKGQIARIPARLSRLQTLMNTLPAILDGVNTLVERGNAFLTDENAGKFNAFMTGLADVSRTLTENTKALDRGLKGFGSAGDMFASSGKKMDKLVSGGQSLVDKEVPRALKSIDDAAKKLGKVMDGMEPGMTKFSRESVDELQRLLVEARRLMANLARLSGKIESDPRRFLLGNPVPEFSVK